MAARRCGADSIELCSWLACGGVTPSIGQVSELADRMDIPLRVLVRSTPDGFVYSEAELSIMLRDIAAISAIRGVHGLVLGALDATALPDRDFVAQALNTIKDRESTFHRAIDRSADPLAAFDRCAALGVDRILTSGAASLAIDGAQRIAQMVRLAPKGMRIAAAGGINAGNVLRLVEGTGVTEVHFAAQLPVEGEAGAVSMSSSHRSVPFATRADQAKIEGVLNTLTKAGLR